MPGGAVVLPAALLLLLVVVLHPASAALKCFECSDCGNSVGEPTSCRSGLNMCMKISTTGRLEKTCGTQEACGYGVAERWGRKLWRQVHQLISDIEPEDIHEVYCCGSDYCNSSSFVGAPAVSSLVTASLLIALASWRITVH